MAPEDGAGLAHRRRVIQARAPDRRSGSPASACGLPDSRGASMCDQPTRSDGLNCTFGTPGVHEPTDKARNGGELVACERGTRILAPGAPECSFTLRFDQLATIP
jgi:hypothetical protein